MWAFCSTVCITQTVVQYHPLFAPERLNNYLNWSTLNYFLILSIKTVLLGWVLFTVKPLVTITILLEETFLPSTAGGSLCRTVWLISLLVYDTWRAYTRNGHPRLYAGEKGNIVSPITLTASKPQNNGLRPSASQHELFFGAIFAYLWCTAGRCRRASTFYFRPK